MAKGVERDSGKEILIHDKFTYRLSENNTLLHFLQNIRDEVHRFAITTHRKKKNKNMFKSPLEEIEAAVLAACIIGFKSKSSLYA